MESNPLILHSKYFVKSKDVYKYTCYLFIATIVFTQMPRVIPALDVLWSLLTGVAALALYILTPLGVFYSMKSFIKKEPPHKYRLFYLAGHTLFLFMLLALAISMGKDIATVA